ncbi:leucine-rich receptor-like protein kinase family protein [Striga asiatica]|uniref:Leucine-rich receptor-like protein kinase family protein n=1 Tax=Striga asiatica TaxID=4170 RepID=A0A5A7QSB5_STRAF|nr:leucine-rich receptor-like protein kinase family protein [Striga asiatica]
MLEGRLAENGCCCSTAGILAIWLLGPSDDRKSDATAAGIWVCSPRIRSNCHLLVLSRAYRDLPSLDEFSLSCLKSGSQKFDPVVDACCWSGVEVTVERRVLSKKERESCERGRDISPNISEQKPFTRSRKKK